MSQDKTPKQKFFELINRPYSGYISFPERNFHDFVDDERWQGWELRFAILPTQENIKKAAQVAADVLSDEDLPAHQDRSYKFFLLNKEDETSMREIGCEGPFVRMVSLSDRDQRGKEFCMYVRQRADGSFEFTPQNLKELILKLWQAFVENGVKIGYMNPQIGDKTLPARHGIVTPVSYTHYKRDWRTLTSQFWDEVHRMPIPLTTHDSFDIETGGSEAKDKESLVESEDSRLPSARSLTERLYDDEWKLSYSDIADPFLGIIITKQDLRDHHLLEDIRPMQVKKTAYLRQNLAESIESITGELIKLRDSNKSAPSKESLLTKINEIKSIVDTCKPEELADGDRQHILRLINEIIESVPRKDDDGKLIVAYQEILNLTSGEDLLKKLKQNPQYIETFKNWLNQAASFIEESYSECIEQDRDRIFGLYTQDTAIMDMLKGTGIHESKLKILIAAYPGRMELNYRQLRQVKKEKLFLIESNNQLQHMTSNQHISKTVHVADFMREVTNAMGFRGKFSRKYKILCANETRALYSDTSKELEIALRDFLSAVLTRRIKGLSPYTSSGNKLIKLLNEEQYSDLKPMLGLEDVDHITYENLATVATRLNAEEGPTEQKEISYTQSLSLFSAGKKHRLYQAYQLGKKNDEISEEQIDQMDKENVIYNPNI